MNRSKDRKRYFGTSVRFQARPLRHAASQGQMGAKVGNGTI